MLHLPRIISQDHETEPRFLFSSLNLDTVTFGKNTVSDIMRKEGEEKKKRHQQRESRGKK